MDKSKESLGDFGPRPFRGSPLVPLSTNHPGNASTFSTSPIPILLQSTHYRDRKRERERERGASAKLKLPLPPSLAVRPSLPVSLCLCPLSPRQELSRAVRASTAATLSPLSATGSRQRLRENGVRRYRRCLNSDTA